MCEYQSGYILFYENAFRSVSNEFGENAGSVLKGNMRSSRYIYIALGFFFNQI